MQLSELLQIGVSELQGAGVAEFELDARILLEHCTKLSRTQIFLAGRTEVDRQQEDRYLLLLERRKRREPLAYIVGEQEFWSLPFHVTPDVLIPRPETEFLLDRVLALTDHNNFHKAQIVDLCCGSGVIAVVLAKEIGRPILASDISLKALRLARKNSERHHLAGSITLVQGDLLQPFKQQGLVSLLVGNPPYVSSSDVAHNLMPEVAMYEPHLALDGGEDGLECIRKIRQVLPLVLTSGGQCFLEIGADQGAAVKKLFLEGIVGLPDFQQVEILVDYAGRDRVVHARLEK